jgi:uncharacterized protein (TIGR03067 family)
VKIRNRRAFQPSTGQRSTSWWIRSRELEIARSGIGFRSLRSLIYPFSTDPAKRPMELDATTPFNQQLGFTGIYKIDGDTLTICWNAGVHRPQAFESSPGNGFTVTTLKRLPGQGSEADRVLVKLRRGESPCTHERFSG